MTTAEQLKTLIEKLVHCKPSWREPVDLQEPEKQDFPQDRSLSMCRENVDFGRLWESEMMIWLRIKYWPQSKSLVLSLRQMQWISCYTTWRGLPRGSCDSGQTRGKTPQKFYSGYCSAHLMIGLPPSRPRGSSLTGGRRKMSPYKVTPSY